MALQWRHGEHDDVSNHQPHQCLLNRLFRRRSKKTPKLRVAGLCTGNSPIPGEFPAQMASTAENVSIWWRHHGIMNGWPWITIFGHVWGDSPLIFTNDSVTSEIHCQIGSRVTQNRYSWKVIHHFISYTISWCSKCMNPKTIADWPFRHSRYWRTFYTSIMTSSQNSMSRHVTQTRDTDFVTAYLLIVLAYGN